MITTADVPVAGWAGVLVSVFWVAVVVGVVLGIGWRRIEDPLLRRRVQWAGSLLFFVPQLPVLLAWNVAVPLVTLQRALLGAWLLGSAAVALVALRRQVATRRGQIMSAVVAVGMAIGGVALGSPAMRNLTSPPVRVAGTIIQTSAGYRTSAPELDIGGERVRVTRDVARHLRTGMTVEGLALSGTRHLVQLRVVDP